MNYKMIRYILSMILSAEAGFMLLPIFICLLYGEFSIIPSFIYTILVILVSVLLLGFKKPKNDKVFSREGFISVSLGWLFISVFGALPFYFSGSIPSIVDCIFETVSGFTTTGATILSEVENLSHGILFWREFTHWIGGMGVIVFLLMLTQISEGHSLYIMRAEVPGPSVGKIAPKARSNSLILYGIYTALTIAEALFLLFGGVPAFDAVTTAMGTAGTGGFSVRNLGIAAYDSAYVEWVVSIFMLIFGVNFNLYYLLLFSSPVFAMASWSFPYAGAKSGFVYCLQGGWLYVHIRRIWSIPYFAYSLTEFISLSVLNLSFSYSIPFQSSLNPLVHRQPESRRKEGRASQVTPPKYPHFVIYASSAGAEPVPHFPFRKVRG